MMVHNYNLYEENGVLSMIPWDYNLAFGGFTGGSDTTSMVNRDIDTLVSSGSDSDRPMAGLITADEENLAQYHAVYQSFIATVFDSGWFAQEFDRVTALIAPYVETDPTAFCTCEEFQTASEILKSFCIKRAQSVANQLSGSDTSVDASELSLSDMGGMTNGVPDNSHGGAEMPQMDFGGKDGPGEAPAKPAGDPSGEMPTFAMPSDRPDASLDASAGQAPAKPDDQQGLPEEHSSPFPDGGFDVSGMFPQSKAADERLWLVICAVLLGAALIFAGRFRKNR